MPISTLSGGDQQKVLVARCLVRDPALLVLCEPTAGVDIGTRVAIYELIAELSRSGLTVVLSSSDAGDVLALCTRVVVLRGGRIAAELGGEGLTEHALIGAIRGRATMTSVTESAARAHDARARTKVPRAKRLVHGLAFDRVGAVYVWLGIIVLFSIWVPDTFPSVATAKQILNANAITALAALSITIPLAARVFDLSIAGVMMLTGGDCCAPDREGRRRARSGDRHPRWPSASAFGVINAVVVVVMRIDSFIATLATRIAPSPR